MDLTWLGVAAVLLPLACAASICVLCMARPQATLTEAATALATALRAVLRRDRRGPP